MRDWQKIEGHLGTPQGFRGAAAAAGIKKAAGTLDLGLLFSEAEKTSAAGVFTTNLAAAAPVLYSRTALRASGGWARAVVVNSGNANAATGRAGLRAAAETARSTAKLLGIRTNDVLVCSTGVIGVPLALAYIGAFAVLGVLPLAGSTLVLVNGWAFAVKLLPAAALVFGGTELGA